LTKSYLTILVAILLATTTSNAYDFSTETITKTIGEEAKVWPVINITLEELSNAGIPITITDPSAIMTIYRLSDLGKAMSVTVYIKEWNQAPPIMFMDKNGSLGHSVANESQVYTQTRVIVYNEEVGQIQQIVIDPWGTTMKIVRRISYSVV